MGRRNRRGGSGAMAIEQIIDQLAIARNPHQARWQSSLPTGKELSIPNGEKEKHISTPTGKEESPPSKRGKEGGLENRVI
jgi:hypothetical protein